MNDIELLFSKPNEYYVEGFGNVETICVEDMKRMGKDYEKFYENLMLPWRLCWRSFYEKSVYDSLSDNGYGIVDYDVFFIVFQNNERMKIKKDNCDIEILQLLKESVDFIFRCKSTIDYQYNAIIIDENRIIYRDNFESIREIILLTNACNKFEIEEEPTFENERQKDIYEKLKNGRQKSSESNRMSLKRLINITMVYTNYLINDKIQEMTMFQLYNTYSSFSVKDGYELNMSYVPIVADTSKLDLEHWSNKLK